MEMVLIIGSLAVAALVLAALVAIPIFIISTLVWLVALPFRLLFKIAIPVVGRLLGGLFSVVTGPILLLVSGVALVGAGIGAAFSPDLPVVPLLLVAFGSWAIYRLGHPRIA